MTRRRCPVRDQRSRTSGLRIRRKCSRIVKYVQPHATPCKYSKYVRREKPKCASPCRLEQESCWILAGLGASGARGSSADATAPLGPPGRGSSRYVLRHRLPDVRARRVDALQGAELDPGAGGSVEGVPGEGAAMRVEVASQLA